MTPRSLDAQNVMHARRGHVQWESHKRSGNRTQNSGIDPALLQLLQTKWQGAAAEQGPDCGARALPCPCWAIADLLLPTLPLPMLCVLQELKQDIKAMHLDMLCQFHQAQV